MSTAVDQTNFNINDTVKNEATLQKALNMLLAGKDLSLQQMRVVMLLIMNGKCPDVLMSAILVALQLKGETVDEITAAASVMRELSLKITPQAKDSQHLVDIVGTGGDNSNLFNVSTAAALVISCSEAKVAKHGNRSVSSKSGSSDLLDTVGIRLDLTSEQTLACIEQQSLGFLFAPNHHPAIRHAMPVRNALSIRTIFNVLGPLTNPAGVKKAVIGVYDHRLCEPLAQVLKNLGDEHILVVGSNDGLDEISLAGDTKITELKNGEINTYIFSPEVVGIKKQPLTGLQITSAQDSLKIIAAALASKDLMQENSSMIDVSAETVQKAKDMIALNAGAAIYVAGCASNIATGVQQAQAIIDSGQALDKLYAISQFTQTIK